MNLRQLSAAISLSVICRMHLNLFLNKYYPAYIKPPNKQPENQSLTFDITTQYVDDYIKLIDSSLAGFNNSHIYGNLDTRNNQLNLECRYPAV